MLDSILRNMPTYAMSMHFMKHYFNTAIHLTIVRIADGLHGLRWNTAASPA